MHALKICKYCMYNTDFSKLISLKKNVIEKLEIKLIVLF